MSKEFDQYLKNYIARISSELNINYEESKEFKLLAAKKLLDYAFTKEFRKDYEDDHYRNLHPGLQDLHDQYKTLEALLKKEDGKK